jgi:hypothetical protein
MRRLAATLSVVVLLATGAPARAEVVAKRPKAPTKFRLAGVSRAEVASWGVAAMGTGQLRVLFTGQSKWQTLHKVPGGSLYRVRLDESGRALATWEKEPHFHLFSTKTNQHVTFAKAQPPSPEFKYGYDIEDLYFTKDGAGAIVYMHGFIGGRSWAEVAYHYDLARPAQPPTLLFRQTGYGLHSSSRLAVYALPLNPQDACEHNFCHPLGAIIGWEISGTTATKRVLLDGQANPNLSRVIPVWGSDEDRVAVLVLGHPRGRYLLRWHPGEPKGDFRPLPPGPADDAETVHLTKSDDAIEVFLTQERGLEIRRLGPKGDVKAVTSVSPAPKRTPRDRPLFDVAGVLDRKDRGVIVHWGEYLVLVPPSGPARRVDMRSLLGLRSEVSPQVSYVPAPEGVWFGVGESWTKDFSYVSLAEIEARATP